MVQAIGCDQQTSAVSNAIYNILACKCLEVRFHDAKYSSVTFLGDREAVAGQFIGWSFLSQTSDNNVLLIDRPISATEGLAVIGCVIERAVSGSTAAAYINADGNTDAVENVVVQMSTVMGQRFNFLYNDAAPYAVKHGQLKFSVVEEINTKSDLFSTDGTANKNWSVIHKLGWGHNAFIHGASNTAVYGVGSWLGEFPAIGEVNGSPDIPFHVAFVDDQSSTGGGAGDGDYRPGGSTELPVIPAGLAPYSYDYRGTIVPNDGSAYIGALQP